VRSGLAGAAAAAVAAAAALMLLVSERFSSLVVMCGISIVMLCIVVI
jgi:hypothetical protein